MKGSCNITALPKALATAALCLAAVGLASCSWCWPSLHSAEAVLHCDKQVVVCMLEHPSHKYRYKGEDWRPIKLACAIDKGKSIYRRGDGVAWCIQNTTDRYQILQESVRTFMVPCETPRYSRVIEASSWDRAIAEQDFPFAKATRIAIDKGENLNSVWQGPSGFCAPYLEVSSAVACMPITQQAEEPATWRRIVAVPLEAVDLTATVAMTTAEVAGIIAILPISAVWNGVAKLFNG